MQTSIIPLAAELDWSEQLVGVPHAIFHTASFISAIALTHPRACSLYCFTLEEGQALIPLQRRAAGAGFDLLTPYGYAGLIGSGIGAESFERIVQSLAQTGAVCSYITNHPIFTASELLHSADHFPANTSYVVDLRADVASLEARLNEGKSRQVKLKQGVFCRDKERLLPDFIRLYQASMQRLGAGAFYHFSPATLEGLVRNPQCRLLGVLQDDSVMACTLFGDTPYVSDFLLNGASDEGRRFSSALLWEGLLEARSKGIPWFNFGGGITPGDSLDHFKSLFGGTPRVFGAFKLIHDASKYQSLCAEKGVGDWQDRSGFFPPYQRKSN